MRIALIQMRSAADLKRNLADMERSLGSAARRGARLVVFPEMAYFTAPLKDCAPVTGQFDELMQTFAGWAKRYGTALIPGSLREPSPEGRHFNTLPVFDSAGIEVARYRKIFLFKAKLPDREYDESAYTTAGKDPVTFTLEGIRFGATICYDLRFPELFRALKKRGAELILLPAAFTVPTGRAHWETLLRARAIENQLYIAAPGLAGRSGNGAATYGNSLVVDPWGRVRVRAAGKPTTLFFTFDPRHAVDCRGKVDAWASRREDLFPIP